MPNVLITYPATGQPICTEMYIDKKTFEAANFQGDPVQCPQCGQQHTLGKKEAYLEGDELKSSRA